MRPVVWAEDARRDYLDILRYIARDKPAAATRVAGAIQRAATGLGRLATGRPGRVADTYEKSVTGLPYVIAYAIRTIGDREAVAILRVIHTARDWPRGGWPA